MYPFPLGPPALREDGAGPPRRPDPSHSGSHARPAWAPVGAGMGQVTRAPALTFSSRPTLSWRTAPCRAPAAVPSRHKKPPAGRLRPRARQGIGVVPPGDGLYGEGRPPRGTRG